MSATEQLRESIRERLRAIDDEVGSLNAALKRLDREAAAATAATAATARQNGAGARANGAGSRRNGSAPRRPTQKRRRSAGPVTLATIEQLLGAGDGTSASDLAEQLNADRAGVLAQLKQLEAQGTVRRTGARRATRWHLITDEERIRERAAELERRSRRPSDAGAA